MEIRKSILITALILGTAGVPAQATVERMKVYKKVFPEFKPECIYCHVDEKPKKDDGKHDLNPYGVKVKELGEEATEEQLKALGSHEEQAAQTQTEEKAPAK